MFDRELAQRSCQETSRIELDNKTCLTFDRSFIEISGRLAAKILTKGTYAESLAQDRLQRDPVMDLAKILTKGTFRIYPGISYLMFFATLFGFSCLDCLFVVFLIS